MRAPRTPADNGPIATGDLLEVQDVSHRYPRPGAFARGDIVAVDDVAFALRRGARLGIVGESGSGKSTVARLLAGLEQPSDGRIVWQGTDVAQLDRSARRVYRRSVQMVFQDPFSAFNPRRSIWASFNDVLRSWPETRSSDGRARAEALVEEVGLQPAHLDRYPHQLSGGQRQRLAIARCLLLSPQVLIADESVSALDVSVQAQVLTLFRRLTDDHDLTLVFISHDLRAVSFMVDEVLVMREGKVVEAGTTRDLMNRPAHPYTRQLIEAAAPGHLDEPAEPTATTQPATASALAPEETR